MSEKPNAHSGDIRLVAFSPDGKTIVSGSGDKTLKVWDVANPRPYEASEWEKVQLPFTRHVPGLGPDHHKVRSYWKNKITRWIQETKPNAGALVVGTTKVWDAGKR